MTILNLLIESVFYVVSHHFMVLVFMFIAINLFVFYDNYLFCLINILLFIAGIIIILNFILLLFS